VRVLGLACLLDWNMKKSLGIYRKQKILPRPRNIFWIFLLVGLSPRSALKIANHCSISDLIDLGFFPF
jgi:hypothetical protein